MLNSLAYNLHEITDLFLELFLNKGIMFASFHSTGTIPSCSDMVTRVQVAYSFVLQFLSVF